jgi:hypothetical protein
MNNANILAKANNANKQENGMEVIVIGSGGVWSKGPTLDAAFDNAKKLGGFGKQVVIAVAPVSIETWVDEIGALRWNVVGGDHSVRPRYVYRPEGTSTTTWWPNRRTEKLRAAVDAVIAG